MINVFCFRYLSFNENTYLVADETKECIIIDPGCYHEKEKMHIADYISFFRLKPVMLINTHCHIDHIFGNNFIQEYFQVPLALHKDEVPFLKAMPQFGGRRGFDISPIKEGYKLLNENDTVTFGRTSLKVLLTPGHSPGSISLYCEQEAALFSGDVVFRNRVGKVDLPGADYKVLVKSIQEKVFTLPDETLIYPGHGPSTTVGHERKNNKFICLT